ncbi:Predicted acetyltransferase [Cellulomonas fimi]|nr:Predicted acetyltransferase [Cellulomonas fimi]
MDRARGWGVRAVVLDTGARNVGAQRLYERLGFERTPTRESAVVPGVGRLVVLVHSLVRPGVPVRRIAPHEHDAVARLSVEAYAHDHELTDSYRASVADVATRAREHEVWVAQDRVTGDLLGTVATPRPGAHISPLGRDGELDFRLLAVAPQARRRGVGALLTRFAVELARERGLRRVVMSSGPAMTGAHRLYESLGFTRLPERETRVVDGATLLAFGLDLDRAAAPWKARTSDDDPGLP